MTAGYALLFCSSSALHTWMSTSQVRYARMHVLYLPHLEQQSVMKTQETTGILQC